MTLDADTYNLTAASITLGTRGIFLGGSGTHTVNGNVDFYNGTFYPEGSTFNIVGPNSLIRLAAGQSFNLLNIVGTSAGASWCIDKGDNATLWWNVIGLKPNTEYIVSETDMDHDYEVLTNDGGIAMFNTNAKGTVAYAMTEKPLPLPMIYVLIDNGTAVEITGYTGPGGDVVIPSEINSLPVTAIGDKAFRNKAAVTSIEIPDSVTTIGTLAFYGSGLTSIVIPDSVTSLGVNVFQNCVSLETVTVGSGVTAIPDYAFIGCTALTSVNVGKNVTSIGTGAFKNCVALASIELPDSVTGIGEQAFSGCTALTSIEIPDSVISIGKLAFYGSGLTSIDIQGNVISLGVNVFQNCVSLGSATVGSGVTAIPDYAFSGCTVLADVTVGSNVTTIGTGAFKNCAALTSLVFEGNAPTVGSGWASGAGNLVVYYHEDATGFTTPTWQGRPCYPAVAPTAEFSANVVSGLAPLTVQFTDQSAGHIGAWQWDFDGDGIVDSHEKNPVWTYSAAGTYTVTLTVSNDFGNDTMVKTAYITVTYFTYTSDGAAVTITGYTGPGGDVVIPSEINGLPVTAIGEKAFRNKAAVTSIEIPDSVITIGTLAFYGSGLTSIVIPDSVISLGVNVFQNCVALETATVGSGVTGIPDYAFAGCTALASVTIGSNVTTIGTGAFKNCAVLASIELPDGVSGIGEQAFSGCTALTSIEIPDSVTTIGTLAFYGSGLTSIVIPDNVTSLGINAFQNCVALETVTIGSGVTGIGNYAFISCSALTSVNVGKNVTTIGTGAFKNCAALTSLVFEGNAPTVGSSWAYKVPSTMTVYYLSGATGFTNPWHGFSTEMWP